VKTWWQIEQIWSILPPGFGSCHADPAALELRRLS